MNETFDQRRVRGLAKHPIAYLRQWARELGLTVDAESRTEIATMIVGAGS